MDSDVTAALAETAVTLREAARANKRAESHHRRQARDLMRQLEELRRVCAEHGITLTTDTAEEAQS